MTADGEAGADAPTGQVRDADIGDHPRLDRGGPPRGGEPTFEPTGFLLLRVAVVWLSAFGVAILALKTWALLAGAPTAPKELMAWVAEHSATIQGVLVLVVPQQLAFFAAAWLAVRKAPEGAAARLGLAGGRASAVRTGAIVFSLAGTIGVQWASSLAVDAAFQGPSDQMRAMWKMLSAPTGAPALAIGLLISVLPGICEEVVFRGLLLRGLLRQRSALVSIAIAGGLFALAHGELQYAAAVLPLGLWLGFLAWRTGSIRLSIACHAANNLSAVVFGRMFGDPESGDLPSTPWMIAIGILFLACAFGAARALPRAPASDG